ncbi:MAG: VCBS repeat-containing protein [Pirellulaceae bacterium]|jgi:hypothetical protein|nr:VCBS repeat-containing protein [Pirellulaceae bacterium]
MVVWCPVLQTIRRFSIVVVFCVATFFLSPVARGQTGWKVHTLYVGEHCNTVVAADYTGDGKTDVICNAGRITRLLVAPDWTTVDLESELGLGLIHSETMDIDADGDPDFIGARYQPGLIFWLERPDQPLKERWRYHLIDDQVLGIHGLLTGDVNLDRRPNLLANSAQPLGPFANSLVWYSTPKDVHQAASWPRHVLANGDAPGLSHYLGLGDVDGDGRPDVASGAKGGPTDKSGEGNWFSWWQAPRDPKHTWKKHVISNEQPGATNIHPADLNGDSRTDFLASRGHGHGVVWFEAPNWKEHTIHATLHGPHCLVVTDLDGDGDTDAATCAKDDKLVAWFENDGQGEFSTHIIARNQAAYDIRAVDLDGDTDLDLLIAGQASKNVVWCENPTK